MKPLNRLQATLFAAGLIAVIGDSAGAQDLGPFMPHEGATLTTAWANSYGPDAEAWMTLFNVTPQTFDVHHASSRGAAAARLIRAIDDMTARTIVLGFSPKMPPMIPNTTSLGTSAAVLNELRTTGQANAAL